MLLGHSSALLGSRTSVPAIDDDRNRILAAGGQARCRTEPFIRTGSGGQETSLPWRRDIRSAAQERHRAVTRGEPTATPEGMAPNALTIRSARKRIKARNYKLAPQCTDGIYESGCQAMPPQMRDVGVQVTVLSAVEEVPGRNPVPGNRAATRRAARRWP